jgi:hypothetical protein
MLLVLRKLNIVLLVSLVASIAGAIAGLIILAPFIAGAWFLNLMAILGYERLEPAPATAASEPVPAMDDPVVDVTRTPEYVTS